MLRIAELLEPCRDFGSKLPRRPRRGSPDAYKQLTLVGYGGRDFATHVPIFCRAEVRYEVLDIAGRACLVRRETHPDNRALDNFRSELVCFDIATIDVRSLELVRGNRQAAPGSIPRALRLKVTPTSPELAAVDEVLHVY